MIPTQPTPEAVSPLVTPPALAPIGSSAMNNVSQAIAELDPPVIQNEEKKNEDLAKEKAKETFEQTRNKSETKREKLEVKREKPVNKRTMRDCPPRFQTNSRKDADERNQYDEPRKANRQSSTGDNKSRKRSADRERKVCARVSLLLS